MMTKQAVQIIISAFFLVSCFATTPLKTSSLDFDKNNENEKIFENMTVEEAKKRIMELMGELNMKKIRERKCNDKRCFLEYFVTNRGAKETVITRYSNIISVQDLEAVHNSTYFVIIRKKDKGTKIRLIGVPMVNEDISCPEIVRQKLKDCKVTKFNTGLNHDLVGVMYKRWKIDISGKVEYFLIKEILDAIEGGTLLKSDHSEEEAI